MSGSAIDYEVEEKNKFEVVGSLDKLYQKNTEGFFVWGVETTFQFYLKLKFPSQIISIETFPKNVTHIGFQFFDLDGKSTLKTFRQLKPNMPQILEIEWPQNIKKVTKRVKIVLAKTGTSKSEDLGLKYLLVRGDRVETKNKKLNKQSLFSDARQSPHNIAAVHKKKSQQVFSNRKKEKSKEEDEDKNLKRAIDASKKQYQRQNKQVIQQESLKIQVSKPRNYNLIEFQRYKNIFANVNSSWLQAQKIAEQDKGVNQKQMLSKCIQVKHFQNKTICVDLAPATRKTALEKMAEDMGAKIVRDPVDNCLLVTNKSDTERVAKARKLKNVKIVSPNFIEECKHCDAYLSERDYFLKL